MDMVKGQGTKKRGLIVKTWERCRSIGRGHGKKPSSSLQQGPLRKSKSLPSNVMEKVEDDMQHARMKRRIAPEGCFSVYVGPQKQRFVIKTEYANHPLFKMLLDEAELEYGYNSEGPLALPCKVDIFIKVLVEMDNGDEIHPAGCNFVRTYSSYRILSPSRLVAMNKL